ncbi:MAG: class I SAM-dependent methyltransferase [Alphaproteobacteria bacterium]
MDNIDTWANLQDEENVMNDHHAPFWRSIITQMQEKDLANSAVLDFGCNQGGFLRTLYYLSPFKKAIGVDIALQSLEVAKSLKGNLPVHYDTVSFLNNIKGEIDIAFSHDVIYLLPDLTEHAKIIANVLNKNGVYYATTGCYHEMPLWNRWKPIVDEYSNVPVPDYSINDFAKAFWEEGFEVSIARCLPQGFVKCWQDRENYFPKVTDFIDYYANKIIFRMVKK